MERDDEQGLHDFIRVKALPAEFGISWIAPPLGCYRLILGDQKRLNNNPFVMEYFFAAKYGGKRKAKRLARLRRAELLATPEFAEYFRYVINGRRVPRARITSSVLFSGVSFVKGVTKRNGKVYASPRFRVYWADTLLASFSLKRLGAFDALKGAVYCRAKKEGREVSRRQLESIYEKWRQNEDVSTFLSMHSIPIR